MNSAVPLLCVSKNPIIPGDKRKRNTTDAGSCPPPPVLTERVKHKHRQKKIFPPQILAFSTHPTANTLRVMLELEHATENLRMSLYTYMDDKDVFSASQPGEDRRVRRGGAM